MAEKVLWMPSVSGKAKDARVQRKCPKCLNGQCGLLGMHIKDEKLQAREASTQTPEITTWMEANINALKGCGQPLSEHVRAFYELCFGYNFSWVSVHTDRK